MLDTVTEVLPNGKKIRVARLGTGVPVIMLHGYPENLQVWNDLAKKLSAHYEVIAFDWPGMGYSEEWSGGATPKHMAKRLAELMDMWKIDKAHLVGQDMGGQPALVFAAQFPSRTISLTVMNSLVQWDVKTSWEISVLRKLKFNMLIIKYFPRLVYMRALSTFLAKGAKVDAGINEDMWKAFSQQRVRNFIVRMCAGYEAQLKKLPELYRQVKCPVFICWGEREKHFPPVHAIKLKENIPHARLDIISGGEHWMCIDKSEEIAGKLLDFYRSLPAQ